MLLFSTYVCVLGGGAVLAQTPSVDSIKVQDAVALGKVALSGALSPESTRAALDKLLQVRRHQQFLGTKGDSQQSSKEDLTHLDEVITRLYSAVQVQRDLTSCSRDLGDYKSVVLEAASTAPIDGCATCIAQSKNSFDHAEKQVRELGRTLEDGVKGPRKTLPFPTLDEIREKPFYSKDTNQIAVARYELREKVFYKALENSLKTAVDLSLRYSDSNLTKFSRSGHVARLVSEHCKDKCTGRDKKKLTEEMTVYAEKVIAELGNGGSKQSEKALNDLNSRIEQLNQKLYHYNKLCQRPREDREIVSLNRVNSEQEEAAFQDYQKAYLEIASQGVGTLLHTDPMKYAAGDKINTTPTSYPHGYFVTIPREEPTNAGYQLRKQLCPAEGYLKITSAKFKDAVKDARAKNGKHIASILKLAGSKKLDGDVHDLYRKNPVALGQVLAQDPAYASIACEHLNSIVSNDRRNERDIEIAMWGGAIVGAALLAPAKLAVGIGSEILGASVETATYVVAAYNIAISSGARIYYRERYKDRIAQILSQQGTNLTLTEAQDLNRKAEDALINAVLTGVTLPLDPVKNASFCVGQICVNEISEIRGNTSGKKTNEGAREIKRGQE